MAQNTSLKKVAILFAGGPAPGANAVISSAAYTFLNAGIEVIGIKHGYSKLIDYQADMPLVEGRDYVNLTYERLEFARTSSGIMIGTARSNPGKNVSSPSHLTDLERVAPLKRVYEGLRSLGVDALMSIGGDDTLKTANKLKLYQDQLPVDAVKMAVVHLPKTIDNDYTGIDFTFGYFTAAEVLAKEIRNLNQDAAAGQSYFVCECMGRSAGWLAYGAALGGDACMVMSVEDICGPLCGEEIFTDAMTGATSTKKIMHLDLVIERMVDVMLAREKIGRNYGVLVVAEGLVGYLPMKSLEGIPRDDHGHITISEVNLNRMFSKLIAAAYHKRTGKTRKVNSMQLGYESRCAPPTAFDVILGAQIGVGAYRALVEEKLNGFMISVGGQFDVTYVPFTELVDPETLVTKVRFIEKTSDFYRLARLLETKVS